MECHCWWKLVSNVNLFWLAKCPYAWGMNSSFPCRSQRSKCSKKVVMLRQIIRWPQNLPACTCPAPQSKNVRPRPPRPRKPISWWKDHAKDRDLKRWAAEQHLTAPYAGWATRLELSWVCWVLFCWPSSWPDCFNYELPGRIEVNALKLLAEAGVAKLVALAGGDDVEVPVVVASSVKWQKR